MFKQSFKGLFKQSLNEFSNTCVDTPGCCVRFYIQNPLKTPLKNPLNNGASKRAILVVTGIHTLGGVWEAHLEIINSEPESGLEAFGLFRGSPGSIPSVLGRPGSKRESS